MFMVCVIWIFVFLLFVCLIIFFKEFRFCLFKLFLCCLFLGFFIFLVVLICCGELCSVFLLLELFIFVFLLFIDNLDFFINVFKDFGSNWNVEDI